MMPSAERGIAGRARGSIPHNSSRLPFSSTNTVVAATMNTTLATIVASSPEAGLRAATSSAWMACAPLGPTRPSTWAMISPCAALSPKKYPETAIAMTRIGVIENRV